MLPVTLAPAEELLPDVLPTDRLFASGKVRPGVIAQLRDIPSQRNALAIASVWVQILASWGLLRFFGHPVVWILVVLWIGRCFSLVFLLNHEAAHRLLFPGRLVNDRVGRVLLGWPALVDFEGYRRAHMSHHKDELGPDEPDVGLYAGYPAQRRRLLRRLVRDALGRSAFKQLQSLAQSQRSVIVEIVATQVALAAIAFLATGRWWAWLVVWLLPWATVWQVINRLRAIAEHAGMAPGPDRRRNTHIVRQHWLSSLVLVPFRSGYHLAHHVDTSVPWIRLPVLHAELIRAGWITPDISHRSYRAAWRYLTTVSTQITVSTQTTVPTETDTRDQI